MIDSLAVIDSALYVTVSVPPEAIKVMLPRPSFMESQLAAALAGVVAGYILSTANTVVGGWWRDRKQAEWIRRTLEDDIFVNLPLAQREILRLRESLDPDKLGGSEAARAVQKRLYEAHSAVGSIGRIEMELQGINDHTLDGLGDFARRAELLLDEMSNASLVGMDAERASHPAERSTYRIKLIALETGIDQYVQRGQKWSGSKRKPSTTVRAAPSKVGNVR